jgi:UDP-N-acetylglucosamine 2-epimerase (non-hydrolysing)
MPEEINRILTDHLADALFVTEESGLRNLLAEGLPSDRIHFVGNTMIDSLLAFKEKAEASTMLEALGLRTRTNGGDAIGRYALMTLHRPANVDDSDALLGILAGISELAADYPVVFPVHPRTRRRITEFGLDRSLGRNIIVTDPLGYLDFLCLMKHAALVVTDSGGVQEETTCLGIPCVTVRENTERPVTVESGTNIVAGTDAKQIKDAVRRQVGRQWDGGVPEKWDGRAAARILDVLIRTHDERAGGRGPRVQQAYVCR